MDSLDPFDGDDSGTVFRDVIMLALAGFVAMVILLLPHLNPPGRDAQASTEPPGNVMVEVRWPDGTVNEIWSGTLNGEKLTLRHTNKQNLVSTAELTLDPDAPTGKKKRKQD